VDTIRAALARIGYGDAVIQEFGSPNEFIARLPLKEGTSSQDVGPRIQSALVADTSLGKFELRRVEYVGPQVGRELQRQAILNPGRPGH
jgi:preprotein translocase subunit SecF